MQRSECMGDPLPSNSTWPQVHGSHCPSCQTDSQSLECLQVWLLPDPVPQCRGSSDIRILFSVHWTLRFRMTISASPFAIKMYSLDFIRKLTNMPDSILSSAFVRSVNGPTLHHTRSPKRICPCGVRDLATVRTVPSHRTQPCPGSATWKRAFSNQWSLIPVVSGVITQRRSFQGGYRSFPSFISYCCGDLHHSWFSIAAYGHLSQSQQVHPICQLLNCIRVRP